MLQGTLVSGGCTRLTAGNCEYVLKPSVSIASARPDPYGIVKTNQWNACAHGVWLCITCAAIAAAIAALSSCSFNALASLAPFEAACLSNTCMRAPQTHIARLNSNARDPTTNSALS